MNLVTKCFKLRATIFEIKNNVHVTEKMSFIPCYFWKKDLCNLQQQLVEFMASHWRKNISLHVLFPSIT